MDQKSDQRETLVGLISGFLLDRVTALVFIAPDPFFFIDSAWVKLGELGNMLSFIVPYHVGRRAIGVKTYWYKMSSCFPNED